MVHTTYSDVNRWFRYYPTYCIPVSRFPKGDSPAFTHARGTEVGGISLPNALILASSNPVRQRLSRWEGCLSPLVLPLLCRPSLTGGAARRWVSPRPVYSLRQPMQALCYRGRCGQSAQEKTPVQLRWGMARGMGNSVISRPRDFSLVRMKIRLNYTCPT